MNTTSHPHNPSKYPTNSNLIRVNEAGHIHFVTTTCYDKKLFFSQSWTRKLVMDAINHMRSKKGFLLLGYVLMPDHAHFLLVPAPCQTISKAVKHIKWYSAIKLLASLRKKGMDEKALWKPGFYDFNIYTQQKLMEKLNYCHMNPVKGGLVESPEKWLYSSFCNYENEDDSVFRVDRWWDYWKL